MNNKKINNKKLVTQKTNSKIVDVNSTLLLSALNENRSNISIKGRD